MFLPWSWWSFNKEKHKKIWTNKTLIPLSTAQKKNQPWSKTPTSFTRETSYLSRNSFFFVFFLLSSKFCFSNFFGLIDLEFLTNLVNIWNGDGTEDGKPNPSRPLSSLNESKVKQVIYNGLHKILKMRAFRAQITPKSDKMQKSNFCQTFWVPIQISVLTSSDLNAI